ncbi:tyrosine-type recombinase/integrase [Rahnella aquatilis]|nr:tyrosine-type recombinase/integrase [Rahnella aquatilis]
MTVSKLEGGQYLVDLRPQGRKGKRVRKRFGTKSEAQHYERWIIATQNNKDWIDKPADRRSLADLIELWWKYHGQALKSGEESKQHLVKMDLEMGSPSAHQVTKSAFAEYRANQLLGGNKPATINKRQMLLSGVFTALIKAGHFHGENPLAGVEQLKKVQSETTFLRHEQIKLLLSALAGDDLKVARLCLATGARWNEAAEVCREAVMKFKVTFVNTKNGKNRTVPISKALYTDITQGKDRQLFPGVDYVNVRLTLKSLIPDLPDGQATHVLRHTFASHFMMNGGNILTLQKILGHASIVHTMAYAHFAPDYLNDAVRLNPLENEF